MASDGSQSDSSLIELESEVDKGKGKAIADSESHTIVQTNFDAYFSRSAAKIATSANLFSSLVQPLTADEYTEGIEAANDVRLESVILREPERSEMFARMMLELREGFNLLCYGYGSKRAFLEDLAMTRCCKLGHVIIVNGYHPEITLKEMLQSIEANIAGIIDLPLAANTPDNQARRIYDYFSQPARKTPKMFLIVHNIDLFLMRVPKAKACFSLLALHPNIHLVASVDHINAPLLWSTSESSARKDSAWGSGGDPPRGFAWLWHDITTLASYDTELAFADKTSITGARGRKTRGGEAAASGAGVPLSNTAVQHVLAAVTDRAKQLFVLMSKHQLESIETEGGDPTVDALQAHGIAYDALFPLSRSKFIATNDTQLRAQLEEFRDHSLVISAQVGATEILWIPMRKERLAKILETMEK